MSKRPVIEKSPNYGFYADALWCTVPLLALACYNYGLRPALLYLAALLTAYVCDCLVTPLHAPGYQTHEPSSEYFAAVIVMLMPATAPYATVVMAVIVSVLVKEAFGGEGHYPFHPAAVGVIVAALSWPSSVLRYPAPGTVLPLFGSMDGITTTAGMNPTLRDGGLPTASTVNLLIGNVSGSLGTVGALVIVACGLYLLARGRLRPSTLIPMLTVMVLLPWLLRLVDSRDVPVLTGIFYPFLILPLFCFFSGLSLAKRCRRLWLVYPVLCGVLTLPCVFLLYNSSALFQVWVAAIAALVGGLLGVLLRKKRENT